MLKVKSIKTNVLTGSLYTWIPVTIVTLLKNGKKTEENDVVEAIQENGHKTVVIKGNITENPEVKTLITWLTNIGYTVMVLTDGADDIWPLRATRNCNFIVKIVPPTESVNNVNIGMLQYLKNSDEIVFNISDMKVYNEALQFLADRSITKPVVTFIVSEWSLKDMIIKDSVSFRFNCRILPDNLAF